MQMQLMAISDQLYITLYITADLRQWHNRPQPVVYCCNQFPYMFEHIAPTN